MLPPAAADRGQDRGGLVVVAAVVELDLEASPSPKSEFERIEFRVPVSIFTPSPPLVVMVFAVIVVAAGKDRLTPLPALLVMVFATIVVARFATTCRLHDHTVARH